MARVYDASHRDERKRLAPTVAAGYGECAEPVCVMRTRWIRPGSAWDLAHDRRNGGYHGPAHARCNRREGAVWGNRLRGKRRGRPGLAATASSSRWTSRNR